MRKLLGEIKNDEVHEVIVLIDRGYPGFIHEYVMYLPKGNPPNIYRRVYELKSVQIYKGGKHFFGGNKK